MIQRMQQGDRAAFATLYGWYGVPIYRQVILPRLPVPELAEDVLRDTFRTALEKMHLFFAEFLLRQQRIEGRFVGFSGFSQQ